MGITCGDSLLPEVKNLKIRPYRAGFYFETRCADELKKLIACSSRELPAVIPSCQKSKT
jgi:hypothetical protein